MSGRKCNLCDRVSPDLGDFSGSHLKGAGSLPALDLVTVRPPASFHVIVLTWLSSCRGQSKSCASHMQGSMTSRSFALRVIAAM